MKGRKPAGVVKPNEKHKDGKKSSKASAASQGQSSSKGPGENKKLATALASHLQSLYKGEGVLVVEDGKRIIFYCTLCNVWAYHDASLVDHLHGKKHKRKQGEATPLTSPPSSNGSPPWENTSKLTPPWKLVGEGKGSAASSSSKRKAAQSNDANKTTGDGSKRRRTASDKATSNAPVNEADALAIVPFVEDELGEEPDEPCRPEDFALALFKSTNLIGRRGKWEKQLLKCSDTAAASNAKQKEGLPFLAKVPSELPKESSKKEQRASSKAATVGGDKLDTEKEREGGATEAPLCTEKPAELCVVMDLEPGFESTQKKPAELCAVMDLEPGVRGGDSANAETDSVEAITGPGGAEAAGGASAAPEAERAAAAEASGGINAPAAVPAKRRRGALGTSATRVCFLCQRPMLEGQVVGSLWNARLKRFACSSRNKHKKFHIFHSHCIADWVVFCSAIATTNVPPALCCPLEADVAHLLSSMHHHHKALDASLGASRPATGATAAAAAAATATGAAVNTLGSAAGPAVANAAVGVDADGSSMSSDDLQGDAWAWAGIPDAIRRTAEAGVSGSSAPAATAVAAAVAAAASGIPVSSEDAAVVAIVAAAAASAAASLSAPPPASSTAMVLWTPGTADSNPPMKTAESIPAAPSAAGGGAAVPAAAPGVQGGAEGAEVAALVPLREVFCPECQGTGRYGPHGSLEHPRYRLAQVFDWIVAMMVARHKATLALKANAAAAGRGEEGDVAMADKGVAAMPAGSEGEKVVGTVRMPAGSEGNKVVGTGRKETATAAEAAGPSPLTARSHAAPAVGSEGDKVVGTERKETAAEAAGPSPPTAHFPADAAAGAADASRAAARSDDGDASASCRLCFADPTVQKAADAAFCNLRVLSAETFTAHMRKGKKSGAAAKPSKQG